MSGSLSSSKSASTTTLSSAATFQRACEPHFSGCRPEVPEYGETGAVNDTSYEQLTVIRAVTGALETAGISAWLFGGWGLDARIGGITRDHGDVEFWVERVDAERSKTALVAAGATALTTQPPTESCEFTWGGTDFSTAYFDRQPDGEFSQPDGRFSDWLFPPGSFVKEAITLDSFQVLAMSAQGMLAMKEQYPKLRNGHPWRRKDIADIETLKAMVAGNHGDQEAPPQCSVRRT